MKSRPALLLGLSGIPAQVSSFSSCVERCSKGSPPFSSISLIEKRLSRINVGGNGGGDRERIGDALAEYS